MLIGHLTHEMSHSSQDIIGVLPLVISW